MDAKNRLAVACAISLFAHGVIMMAPLGRSVDFNAAEQRMINAVLRPSPSGSPIRKATPLVEESEAEDASSDAEPTLPSSTREEAVPGIPLPLPAQARPASQSPPFANNQQLAYLAQQRAQRAMQLQAQMAALAGRLQRIVDARIDCRQIAETNLECTPAQSAEVLATLRELAGVVREANRFGVADNPVHLDFGAERGVRMTVQP